MAGYLLLAGGAEFGGEMAVADRRAIQLAGGPDAAICIIPTAALADGNRRAGENGRRWFSNLGARHVQVLPLEDRTAANRPDISAALRSARLIYMLGGWPGHLAHSLSDSQSWDACLTAHQNGAVIGGSSAGAMVMCEFFYNPATGKIEAGLGLIGNACLLPHHDTYGATWAPRLAKELPSARLIGIDERTGMIGDTLSGGWQVYGPGAVTIYRKDHITVQTSGDVFPL